MFFRIPAKYRAVELDMFSKLDRTLMYIQTKYNKINFLDSGCHLDFLQVCLSKILFQWCYQL